jgi:3-hydroxyacyl-CoA dehydrogenase
MAGDQRFACRRVRRHLREPRPERLLQDGAVRRSSGVGRITHRGTWRNLAACAYRCQGDFLTGPPAAFGVESGRRKQHRDREGAMHEPIRYEISRGVAILVVDHPPVNAMTRAVWDGLAEAIATAMAADAAAIVIRGAGTTFPAGADLRLFDTLHTREAWLARAEAAHASLRRIEDAPIPIVAAIHGNALGGGLELALACHFRLATRDATLGQPEVRFGILPGAGGTQRLPRLCGPERALSLCVSGRPIPAAEALATGLIDAIIDDDLSAGAVAFALERAQAGIQRRTREIAIDPVRRRLGLDACAAMRASLPDTPGNRAAQGAIDAIAAGLAEGFDTGSRREREIFAERVLSGESRALRYLFFAERATRKLNGTQLNGAQPGNARPDSAVPHEPPLAPIARAAVVGAGTMGIGIAMAYADAGIAVLLQDVDGDALARGVESIRGEYASACARRRLTDAEAALRIARITPTVGYDAFDTVDVVVEAVSEDEAIKGQVFAELAAVTRPDCLLASNTSTLDIDVLAAAAARPSQVVGHHFFNPAHKSRLIEIVRGAGTSPAVIAASLALARRLGKFGVVVGNGFGFVGNRMLAPYLRESHLLLEEGASVAQVDSAATAFGMAMGPFAMQDLVGIDIGARVRQFCRATGRTWAEGPQSDLPDRLFALGRLGRKTRAGWYRYDDADGRLPTPDPIVATLAAETAAQRGVARREVGDEEIVERLTGALVNAGAALLADGRARDAGDIDVMYVHGYGFPSYRGGPMFYADAIGLGTVVAQLQHLRARLGAHWAPAPLLEQLAAAGQTLTTPR